MRRHLGFVLAIAATMLLAGAAVAQASWWPIHGEIDHGLSGQTRAYVSISSPALGEGFLAFDRLDQGRAGRTRAPMGRKNGRPIGRPFAVGGDLDAQ